MCCQYEFEVVYSTVRMAVKRDTSHCTCGKWDLTCISCVHAMSCINTIRVKVEDYVSPYFLQLLGETILTQLFIQFP